MDCDTAPTRLPLLGRGLPAVGRTLAKINAPRFDFCSFFVQATLAQHLPFQSDQSQSCELIICNLNKAMTLAVGRITVFETGPILPGGAAAALEPKRTRVGDAFVGLVLSAVLLPLLGAVEAAALNAKLSNGVLLQTVHPAPAAEVAIRLLVPVGGRNDPRGREGLAHYVEHLLAADPGPLSATSSDGALRLSAHGYANAYTWPTATVYVMNVGQDSLESALSLLAERLSRLAASDAIAERERRIVQQEYYLRYGDNPGLRFLAELRTKIGRTDPMLGWNIGTPDSIRSFDLSSAQVFFDRWYRPETMTLVLSGPLDIENVREVAERTIGLIPQRPAVLRDAGPVPPVPAPVVLERDDPDAAVPMVLRNLFVRAAAGPAQKVIAEHAAMLALQYLLMGLKEGSKGLLATLRDSRKDLHSIDAEITRLDRRWLVLGMSVEADPAASRNAIADLVTKRLASLTERDVPDRLITEIRNLADRTWIAAEDAPNADDVVDWLRLGFSLNERSQLHAALISLKKKDVVAFAHKVARPDTSATGFLRPSR
jgi:zinc protease